jgi:hypothetical protein
VQAITARTFQERTFAAFDRCRNLFGGSCSQEGTASAMLFIRALRRASREVECRRILFDQNSFVVEEVTVEVPAEDWWINISLLDLAAGGGALYWFRT